MNTRICWLICLVLLIGCANAEYAELSKSAGFQNDLEAEYPAIASEEVLSDSSDGSQAVFLTALQGPAVKPPPVSRKIIYNAQISAQATQIEEFAVKLNDKLAELGGFIANQNEQRHSGERRIVSWTLRVNASQFSEFLMWIDGVVNVTKKEINSQDVTEQFVDLTARLSNKKSTEQRLLTTLEERPGKLEDVLAIEREIDRVREEVERIEGRLRFLSEQTAFSTITLNLSTRTEYVVAEDATFVTRAGETWGRSLAGLRTTGEITGLVIVALTPWVPVLLVITAAIYLVRKKAWKVLTNRFSRNTPNV